MVLFLERTLGFCRAFFPIFLFFFLSRQATQVYRANIFVLEAIVVDVSYVAIAVFDSYACFAVDAAAAGVSARCPSTKKRTKKKQNKTTVYSIPSSGRDNKPCLLHLWSSVTATSYIQQVRQTPGKDDRRTGSTSSSMSRTWKGQQATMSHGTIIYIHRYAALGTYE